MAAIAAGHAAAATPVVHVQLRNHSVRVGAASVPVGLVRFTVVNEAVGGRGFAIAGRRTPTLAPGKTELLRVQLPRAGRYRYSLTIGSRASRGARGTLVAAPRQPPLPALQLVRIGSFDRPVYVTSPPGDPDRLAVVEQTGTVRLLLNGQLQARPFLDISALTSVVSERGLFSLAFAPDYATSRRFYVDYTDRVGNGNVNVVEYRTFAVNPNVADPTSARTLLQIEKPWENHNAGMLEFGPDGNLYVSVGDGDSVLHKPGAFAQTLDDLLGNILRIDTRPDGERPYTIPPSNPFARSTDARPEIWDYGLRNPWRFWIDPPTGDLYIADVALGGPEEIDYVPGNRGGLDFGWPCFQGSPSFDATASCPGPAAPVYEYAHERGECGVIGGVVVRDPRLPGLDGRFLFTDLCGGDLESLLVSGGKAEVEPLGLRVDSPVSFGVDALGRVYVTSLAGPVYRIDPAG